MSQTFMSMVRDGQCYMKEWPVKKELYSLFPESRIISATQFSIKWMPPMAVLCLAVMLEVNGIEYLPQAITIAAFFLSLPFQGLNTRYLLRCKVLAWYSLGH